MRRRYQPRLFSALRRLRNAASRFSNSSLETARIRFVAAGSIMQHPPFLTVTGQLFYDDAHVGDQPREKKGCKAETLWEIHPITSIGLAVH